MDRATQRPVFMVSPAGGIDIEEVAAKTPEKIRRLAVDPRYGLLPHQALQLDPNAALLLPCNVVLEPAPDGGTRVRAVDPRALMPEPEFAELAESAAAKLTAALDTASHGTTGS